MYWSKKLLYLLIPIAVLIAIELLFVHPHANFFWEAWAGYDAVFGFVSSAVLALIAKPLMDDLVKRPEDYYEEIYVPKGYHSTETPGAAAGKTSEPQKEDRHD